MQRLGPLTATNSSLRAARTAYSAAMATCVGVVDNLSRLSVSSLERSTLAGIVAVAGAVAGTGIAAGAAAGNKDGSKSEGIATGGIAGGVVGGVGALLAAVAIAGRVAGQAQRAAQKAAQTAYRTAVHTATSAELLTTKLMDPTSPRIEITSSAIYLRSGPVTQIKLTPTSIEIKGMSVTINDQTMGPFTVPPPPPRPTVEAPDLPLMPPIGSEVVASVERTGMSLKEKLAVAIAAGAVGAAYAPSSTN
jgi:hypothetical protein